MLLPATSRHPHHRRGLQPRHPTHRQRRRRPRRRADSWGRRSVSTQLIQIDRSARSSETPVQFAW